jgi:hypothetical protein
MKKFIQGKPFHANFVTKTSVWKLTYKCMKGYIPVKNHFPVDIATKCFLRRVLLKGMKELILEKNLSNASFVICGLHNQVICINI